MKILFQLGRWWSRLCLRSVCLVLNLSLSLSALVLGFVLWMQTHDKAWVMPDWAGQKLRAMGRPYGLDATYRELIFDAFGYAIVRDLELRNLATGELFLRIPRLHTRLDLGSLWCGQVQWQFVECFNLQIPQPRIVPSEGNSWLLEQCSVRLENTGAWWVLTHAQARSQFGTLLVRGNLGFPAASSPPAASSGEGPLDPLLRAWVRGALFLQEHASLLSTVHEPCLEVAFHQSDPLAFSMELETWIGGLQMADFSAGQGYLRCQLECEEKRFSQPSIEIRWRDLRWRELRLARLETALHDLAFDFPQIRWPTHHRLHLSDLHWDRDYLPGLSLRLSLPGAQAPAPVAGESWPSRLLAQPWQISTALFWFGQPIAADLDWDGPSRTGHARLAGWIDFPRCLERWHSHFEAGNHLQTEQPIQFQLAGEFTEQARPRSLEGSAWLGESTMGGVPVTRATVHGAWNPAQLNLHEVEVYHPEHQLRGSYEENLETHDFRFLVHGQVDPPNLNPVFDDWWDNLWTKLVFAGPDLAADVDYHSRWGDPGKGEIHAWGRARQLQLHGMPIESCSLRVWRKMGFVELFDISAVCPEGLLDGSLRWIYPHLTGTEETQTQFALQSTVPLAELQKIVTSLEPITPLLSLAQPPLLRARGYFADVGHQLTAQRIDLATSITGDFRFNTLPFTGLQLEARLRGRMIHLDRVETKFCEGLLSGNADLAPAPPGGARPIRLQCQLLEAAYPQAWQEFQKYLQKDQPPPSPERLGATSGEDKPAPLASPGRIGLTAFLEGTLGDEKSLTGEGSLWIRQPELSRIRMFGLLSLVLDSVGLGFTTLNLSDVNGNFHLTPHHIQLPDLKITGANATIDAVGHIARGTGDLSFSVNLFLPNLFILNPLSYVLSMRLRGTVEDPQWTLAIDPRNWFRSKNDPPMVASP